MTDAVLPPSRAAGGDRSSAVLFALAIFTSASLVFLVQPMITKLVLPQLGGSPAVWNTSMVFFQAALLAGYAYAHVLQRVSSLKHQVAIHLGLLLLAALFLPLRVTGVFGEPPAGMPVVWLLGVLAVSVGAAFAILSATAPLLQAWFARVRAGEPEAKNPYVLYAASNLGSFVALLAYPALVEPLLALGLQTVMWSLGYALFVAMIVALGVLAWRRGAEGQVEAPPLESSAPIPWREKGIWILLAAAPSSLMLGVTMHLTTDVASAPFLWVIPLALYLLTFVVAFSARPAIPWEMALLLQGAFIAACVVLLPFSTMNWVGLFVVHLGTFFFTALVCHQALAARRPPPDRLTEFYLMLSLGGVVGGALTALVAPVIFDVVREYPLVLVLAVLARPWGKGRWQQSDWFWLVAAILLSLVPMILFALLKANREWVFALSWNDAQTVSRVLLGVGSICAFLIRDRAVMFMLALAGLTVSAHAVAGRYDWISSERSFFGVMRVARIAEPRRGGEVRMLLHGTTLHGAQAVDPQWRCVPMLYYAPTTPIGMSVLQTQFSRPNGATIGVVGLGTGAVAAYKREADTLNYFEIDPLVDRMARDPAQFQYISECAQGPVRTVLGDARLTLAREPTGTYDLLIIDAFSSDAVPTHLLTVEALRGYLRALKPDGVALLHLSNRNLEITTPAIATARAAGAAQLHQIYGEDQNAPAMADASTEALLIARTPEALARFRGDPRWKTPGPTDTRPWTDDYINLVGALWRNSRLDLESARYRFMRMFKSDQ